MQLNSQSCRSHVKGREFYFLRSSDPLNIGMGTNDQIQLMLSLEEIEIASRNSSPSLAEEPRLFLPIKPVMASPDLVALQSLPILLQTNLLSTPPIASSTHGRRS